MVSLFLAALPMVPYGVLMVPAAQVPPLSPVPPVDPPVQPHPAPPDGAEGDAASPFSSRRIAERSKGWEWKRLEGEGWKLLMADHFVLRGDVGIEELRRAGAYLEAFWTAAVEVLGGDAEGHRFSVRLYRTRADFHAYAAALGAPNAESLYDPRQSEIVLSTWGMPGPAWFQRTLAHEFAHAYMDRVWKRTGPLWLAEGVAEYFAHFRVREGRVEPGAPDPRALLLLEIDPPVPLKEFLRYGREEMYGITYAHRYAQAWALVHHLFARPGGIAPVLASGEAPGDPDVLERDWREHLAELRTGTVK
jgi:hypothetical protein